MKALVGGNNKGSNCCSIYLFFKMPILSVLSPVHKERLMKFMKHFARVPSSNKIVEKKFVRIGEASMTYSIGHHRFIEMARAAGAVYKIGTAKGNTILINLEIFDDYMEQFREPPTEMKHPLPNVKGD